MDYEEMDGQAQKNEEVGSQEGKCEEAQENKKTNPLTQGCIRPYNSIQLEEESK